MCHISIKYTGVRKGWIERGCMILGWIDPVYIENVHHFVEEAMRHVNREKKSDIFCPCVDCDNKITWSDSKVVKSYLIREVSKKATQYGHHMVR
jgi:hypothetical protein